MRLRAVHRLFLSYLLLLALAVAALTLGVESILRRELIRIVEGDLRREIALAGALYPYLGRLSPDSVADLLGALAGRRVTLVAPDGRVLGDSELDGAALARLQNHNTRPEVRQARDAGVSAALRSSTTLGEEHLYLAARGADGQVLRLAVPLHDVNALVRRLQRGILGTGVVALVLAGLFSLGYSAVSIRPLERIAAAARRMAEGDLSARLRLRRHDEFGELAAALDGLADELQRRIGQAESDRAEMRALFDSMSEGVLALGADGTVRRANPAARRIFHLPQRPQGIPTEAVARRPEFLTLVGRVMAGSIVPPTELTFGRRRLLASAHPLADGGAVLVFLDVSELKRLEDARRDFVANASHELKTPLTAIRGYSETLLDEHLPPELARRFAEVVKSNADRLQQLVDDLLDLSRIESGGWRAEPEPVALAEAVREAWEPCSLAFSEKQVELQLDVPERCRFVHADPGALRQILSNLFGNALRYTPEGGHVRVRATAPHEGADRVEVAVSDDGAGIPAVHLPRIFERFYRVDPARSRAEGGTGLGLAIVKHLVEAHGGRVGAESELGRGTTIRFTLPALPAEAHLPEA